MEQKGVQLDIEEFSCSICLDLLKHPVTIPCGHSYCKKCIKSFWDDEKKKKCYSCPQCRQTFGSRPALMKNTMLASLVKELKKTRHQDAPDDHHCAGPEDVASDFMSHKLVGPSKNLQENICSRHGQVMKMFCRTDQQNICYVCALDQHKGHNTVSAAAESTDKQRELEVSRQNIHQKIQDKEKDVKLLQQEMEAINQSADKAVQDSEKMFTEMIHLIQKRSSDVKQQVRSQQAVEASRVYELQEKLEQEIAELKREYAELQQLSGTKDHNQHLQLYPSLSAFKEPTHSSSIDVLPLRYFEDVTATVSELRDKLQELLTEKRVNLSPTVSVVDGLQPPPEPKTRAELLKYSQDITLDPNTVETHLLLSEGHHKVTQKEQQQPYPNHPDRFIYYSQVLSRESLNGHSYWEVEWSGVGVYIAVAYKNIGRKGKENIFGHNDKSWALDCKQSSFTFWHSNADFPVSGPFSSRIGVYLDHKAGVLSFYSVSETITLVHRVQTTFTQPLHAGLWVYFSGDSAEFVKVKQT
ncbi:tripartite motif-containing protein 16-like [Pholidichthys leucotaenia]